MNEIIQNRINKIIINLTINNRDISINELKRKIKNEIRLQIGEEEASKTSMDYIMSIIMENRSIIFNQKQICKHEDDKGER